jgi:hypothetical protein
VAREEGLDQFCMGLNEMHTGDALQTHEHKRELNRLFERVAWELDNGEQDVA